MQEKAKIDRDKTSEILEVIMSYARMDFSSKIKLDDDGNTLDAIAAGVNMLGEELKTSTVSLNEKNQLLREIHHRVKNNMQIISSLLNLQSEDSPDSRFQEMVMESKNRIAAMALVHEMLYASTDFLQTNFLKYTHQLTSKLLQSYIKPNQVIDVKINASENIFFDIDRIIPIGLIMNEALSNSFKYAFEKSDGEITIDLTNVGDKFLLEIRDNGVGLKNTFDSEKDSNLGMQLIHLLAEQIGGEIQVINKNGLTYVINF